MSSSLKVVEEVKGTADCLGEGVTLENRDSACSRSLHIGLRMFGHIGEKDVSATFSFRLSEDRSSLLCDLCRTLSTRSLEGMMSKDRCHVRCERVVAAKVLVVFVGHVVVEDHVMLF